LGDEPFAQLGRQGLLAREPAGRANRLADLLDVRDAAGAVGEMVLEAAALFGWHRVLDVVRHELDDLPAAELSHESSFVT
jgi:hypothetical protein